MYVWHACILFSQGHTHYHHVCMVCMHLISTWIYSLPSCVYGMHASYFHKDIPTTIMKTCMHLISTWIYPQPSCMYGMHASYFHMDIPTTIMYVWYACILTPHGYTHYHHVCKVCNASYLHMDILPTTTTMMYVWHACILSPQGHTHYHHVCMVCMHLISTWIYSLPSCM